MTAVSITPDLDMAFRIDNCTDPWREADTIVFLHGIAESSIVWYAWVPALARHFRLLRPDLRGFGESSAMPVNFPWSLDRMAADVASLTEKIGLRSFHLVGAKLGGTIAIRLAATHPERVRTLAIAGSPVSAKGPLLENVPLWLDMIEQRGLLAWAASSMSPRLGVSCPPEAKDWWARMMSRAPVASVIGLIRHLPEIDVWPDLVRIRCPTLVVTGSGGGLGSVEEVRLWQERIAGSELVLLPTDAYHVAAAEGDRVAALTRDFIERLS